MQAHTGTEFNADVEAYLGDHRSVTLSTSSFTGLPHANTAPYVCYEQRLFFFVRHGSVLLRNLVESRHAAFTVDDYGPTGHKQRELHGIGSCRVADDQAALVALDLCAERFGDSVPTGALWCMQPSGMYFIEYTV